MAASQMWKYNEKLKSDLELYVQQNLHREEMINFLQRDFPLFKWSIRTLDRRLRYFAIYYIDKTVKIETVKQAVEEELDGPGALLGYRALHQKIRQKYDLRVPRDLVHNLMYDTAPELLEERRPGNKKKKEKGHFITKGTNWVLSLDGHDKLMGYQNSTFPLAVYVCIDTASRKILWLKIWKSNSKPEIIGKWYLEYLYQTRILPSFLRVDKGTETGVMATMHSWLRQNHNDIDEPEDSIIYGPSTSNQIERWWKELHERLEKYFKVGLLWLKEEGHYDPHKENDRSILAFLMIPLLQRELDEFKDIVWNSHRIRQQNETYMPDGVPNHIYEFPEKYDLENCGHIVTEEKLQEVASLSGVLDVQEDYLDAEFRKKYEEIISEPEKITAKDYVESYLLLKHSIQT